MKKTLFFGIFLLLGLNASPQNFFLSFYGGLSNYNGDLQAKPVSLTQSHFSWGLGLMFELNDQMLVRTDFTYGKISGADKFGSKNRSRNLSFQSNVSELSLTFEYTLLDLYQYRISPYFFTGIAGYTFSPYTKDARGNIIILSEINTEGQGFYKGRKPYKLRQAAIPLGGGILWALSDNKRVGVVVGVRKTFTDYLDDVSTTYVDAQLLAANRGTNALNFAYRGNELPDGAPYPADGTPRGNPKNKDWYIFTGVTLRVRIAPGKQKTRYTYKKRRARISCPRPL